MIGSVGKPFSAFFSEGVTAILVHGEDCAVQFRNAHAQGPHYGLSAAGSIALRVQFVFMSIIALLPCVCPCTNVILAVIALNLRRFTWRLLGENMEHVMRPST